ncbi:MAG: glyoxalase/bleomycin resistance/dioxygenase family protein [Desulfobacterales bacterium]|nr:glyoxalase/bleomycin resistance/dioxygenase family protein [Desulfobacterales bacterium]
MILAFAHPGIVVPNLEKAIDFYRRMFGFEVISHESWEKPSPDYDQGIGLKNSAAKGCLMKGHNCYLELFEFTSPSQRFEGPDKLGAHEPGIRHIAFYVDDARAEYQRLLKLGGQILGQPVGSDNNGYVVYARDPFGNIIELSEIPCPEESPDTLPGISSLGNYQG